MQKSPFMKKVYRAATVNRNIGYPRIRTHGSVSVRLFQISIRSRFVFFLLSTLLKQTFWLENVIKYSPVIIILLLSFKERENMASSCEFKSPARMGTFRFSGRHFVIFFLCLSMKKYTNLHHEYMFWMWNTNSIQLLEPKRNNRKPTSKIKTEPNRKKNLNRGSPDQCARNILRDHQFPTQSLKHPGFHLHIAIYISQHHNWWRVSLIAGAHRLAADNIAEKTWSPFLSSGKITLHSQNLDYRPQTPNKDKMHVITLI